MKSGNLNFLEPAGPLQACNGTALPLPCVNEYIHIGALFSDSVGLSSCVVVAAALYLSLAVVSSPIVPRASVNHIEYLSIAATSGCNYCAGCMPSRSLYSMLTCVVVLGDALTVQGGWCVGYFRLWFK
jgi:hypothetical protein